jgi:hypothetical protein
LSGKRGSADLFAALIIYRNIPKEKIQKKATDSEESSVEEYPKQLPPHPEEHAHELKMEKRLKRLIEEQEKR